MLCPMFIRRTRTRTGDRGEVYYSHRLVRSERSGEKVRQRTLLNLGSDFPVERGHWAVLCARIQQLLDRQGELVPLSCPEEVERHAQRIAAQLLNSAPSGGTGGADLQTVDVGSLELIRPRSVGVEHVGLWAMERLGLEALLERLGFNGTQRALAMATVIARMAAPGSERASWRWLCERSALGELLGVDFERMSMMRLYRASDALMSHRAAIEAHLFDRATDLFGLRSTVTLYDLTNTFFEGAAAAQPKAERGHSKEKRSDCPLLTLGLVLDGSGFVRRSEVFSGAVNENRTLASMLGALGAPADALVVMDAGIATEANIAWLRENGYRYLAVSRERTRRFDPELALAIETRSRQTVHVHKVVDAEGGEARLYCYSEARAKKEQGIANRFAARFEGELKKLHDGLSRPRTRKRLDRVWQRIGRIREKSRGAGAHYDIDVIADESGANAHAVTWKRRPLAGTMITHPGVYCLRTNVEDWDEEALWRTTSLAMWRRVFRSLKRNSACAPSSTRPRGAPTATCVGSPPDRADPHVARRQRERGGYQPAASKAGSRVTRLRPDAPFMPQAIARPGRGNLRALALDPAVGGQRQNDRLTPVQSRKNRNSPAARSKYRPSAMSGSRLAGSRSASAGAAPPMRAARPGLPPRPALRRAGGTRRATGIARAAARGTCARRGTGWRPPAPCPRPRPARTFSSISRAPGWPPAAARAAGNAAPPPPPARRTRASSPPAPAICGCPASPCTCRRCGRCSSPPHGRSNSGRRDRRRWARPPPGRRPP